MDEQEKTIFNALVLSVLQNYRINLKKFMKRRMDHMSKMQMSEQQMGIFTQQAHMMQAQDQALASYRN